MVYDAYQWKSLSLVMISRRSKLGVFWVLINFNIASTLFKVHTFSQPVALLTGAEVCYR
jgi:hypothetical protein